MSRPLLPIPIAAAREIAEAYGYDQIVILGRRVGGAEAPHGEHVTTYGTTTAHCIIAAHMGNDLKHRIMGWPANASPVTPTNPAVRWP